MVLLEGKKQALLLLRRRFFSYVLDTKGANFEQKSHHKVLDITQIFHTRFFPIFSPERVNYPMLKEPLDHNNIVFPKSYTVVL